MGSEMRHRARIEKRLAATVERGVRTTARSRVVRAELRDVSRTGLGLRAVEPFDPDESVRITIHLEWKTEEGQDLAVEGFVTSCEPLAGGDFRVGINLKLSRLHDAQVWHDLIQRWRNFIN